MLLEIGLTLGLFAIAAFVKFDGPEAVMYRYRRFRKLNKFVAGRYKNCCRIFCVSCELVGKSMYLTFVQWLNNSVEKIDKHRYTINYTIKGKPYTLVVKPINGPSPVLLVTDENGNDVSDHVIPFIGPQHDFHGAKITPQFLGYKSLTLETAFGDSSHFGETDVLHIEE